MRNLVGVSQDDELFAPILTITKSRSIQLDIDLCIALLAAAIIDQFEAVLTKVVALAMLTLVVANMSVVVPQMLTVIIRSTAMGKIDSFERLWLCNKEL